MLKCVFTGRVYFPNMEGGGIVVAKQFFQTLPHYALIYNAALKRPPNNVSISLITALGVVIKHVICRKLTTGGPKDVQIEAVIG